MNEKYLELIVSIIDVLVHDNPEQIEGKINDQLIVILTKFVKKG